MTQKSNKTGRKAAAASPSRTAKRRSRVAARGIRESDAGYPLIFKKNNYLLMIGGVILMALGFLLMSGGSMPSPDVWDESIIYSPRRTLLAPIVILAGLALEIVAIFKK
jgi:hypothetical protein